MIKAGVHKPVNQFRFRFGQPKPVSVNKPVETSLEETGFGFKPIRMRPRDEWKTAFKTRDGLYEWMVMPFGLSNAPRTGIRMDTTKISVITIWPPPTSLHDVRSFHGLPSFYRRFIRGFSTIIAPITECLKSSKFVWNTAAQSIFEQLKHAVTEASVLALPNFEHVCQVERDASGLRIVENEREPILDQWFVEKCRRKYGVVESVSSYFQQKEINIMDPLDMNNNLGKSVKNKDDFIQGIVEGHRKMSEIEVSSEMVSQFPVLGGEVFARSGGQSELLDLKGEDSSGIVEEART
uniref:Putative nucleotidyltransferase, ribonuclease H n=1 Tax=Tanacetum cinerariifolium TaxID=118510 RepID=A0A6L2JXA3_TANCI|nr:putative nucleotidyltransferase, ribonuclease H [Tanacetum cinerariifolium]